MVRARHGFPLVTRVDVDGRREEPSFARAVQGGRPYPIEAGKVPLAAPLTCLTARSCLYF